MTLTPFDEGYVPPEPKPAPVKAEPAAPKAKAQPRAASASSPRSRTPEEPSVKVRDKVRDVADGIYFDMPDDVYHEIERLSTSGIQRLLTSPADFWEGSWLNFDPEAPAEDEQEAAKESKALIYGRAYHVARLEPSRFQLAYVRNLDKSEMPKGTLFTAADMGRKLEELGLKKSGSAWEQAERLRDAEIPECIWYIELDAWERRRGDRIGLPAKIFDQIAVDMERIRASPKIAELLREGIAEVSIFWTCPRTGIKMKARLDLLRLHDFVDLKTFDNSKRKNVSQAIVDTFQYNRYYIQPVVYREAVEAIRNGAIDIVGEASEAARDMIAAIQLATVPHECWYVFVQKGNVPNILGRQFMFNDLPPSHYLNKAGLSEQAEREAADKVGQPTIIARKAALEIAHAKRIFLTYSEVYEPGQPWLPFDPLGTIGDDDFSSYFLDARPDQ